MAYGPDSAHQFGDLRLPRGAGPFPVAVVLHGGCWLSQYGLDQISQPAAGLLAYYAVGRRVDARRAGVASAAA